MKLPTEREFHPLADIFPMMGESDLAVLAADIKQHGLREPIVVDAEGRILDGRNRYLACERAGVKPAFRTWDGESSAVAYVVSLNLHRRHLDESQRALIAAAIANLRDGQRQVGQMAEVPTQKEAADLLNVSERSVRRARKVIDRGKPALVDAVKRGEITVSKAAKLIDTEPAAPAENLGTKREIQGNEKKATRHSRSSDEKMEGLADKGYNSQQIAQQFGLRSKTVSDRINVPADALSYHLGWLADFCERPTPRSSQTGSGLARCGRGLSSAPEQLNSGSSSSPRS